MKLKTKFMSIILTFILALSSISTVLAASNIISITPAVVENNDKEDIIELVLPEIKGFEAGEKINQRIRTMISAEIENITDIAKDLKKLRDKDNSSLYTYLYSAYDYTLNGDILSLWINVSDYMGGAHGNSWITSYTANTKTNEIYEFKNLFKENSGYEKIIKASIKNTIAANKDDYFQEASEVVDQYSDDFNFYIDGNNIVIYFPRYEIAPYAGGIRMFLFSAENLKNVLKDDVYKSISNSKPLGNTRLNGKDVKMKNPVYKSINNSAYVPLIEVAELLGHKTSWNINGTLIDGKPISKKIRTETKNEVLYVPIDYFKSELNEIITYSYDAPNYEPILRIFKRPKYESEIYKGLIK